VTDTMPQIGGAPYRTPQVRQKLPAPHSRPRIDLDGGRRVKRSWQDVAVTEIKKGDTVASFGTVAKIEEWVQHDPYQWKVRLFNLFGDAVMYPGEQRVFAFAQDPQL
jgi:hypothetical protein